MTGDELAARRAGRQRAGQSARRWAAKAEVSSGVVSGPPVPWRITTALDAAGLHGPAVDEQLGVLEPTVDLWEAGQVVPTRAQVARLAALTGFPVAWFHRPEARHTSLDGLFVCPPGPTKKRGGGRPAAPDQGSLW